MCLGLKWTQIKFHHVILSLHSSQDNQRSHQLLEYLYNQCEWLCDPFQININPVGEKNVCIGIQFPWGGSMIFQRNIRFTRVYNGAWWSSSPSYHLSCSIQAKGHIFSFQNIHLHKNNDWNRYLWSNSTQQHKQQSEYSVCSITCLSALQSNHTFTH